MRQAGFKKAAFVIAALFVAVLAVLPMTGPFLRQQVRFGLGGQWVMLLLQGNPIYSAAERMASVDYARRHPNDFRLQFAAAMQDTRTQEYTYTDTTAPDEALLARLANLQSRFPGEPAAVAAYLRYASRGSLGRVAEQNLLSARPLASGRTERVIPQRARTYWESHPGFVMGFAFVAKQGQRLDPDNAFFPYVLAGAYLAIHRDTDADLALKQAAGCSRWEDYRAEEVEAQITLQTARYGDLPSLVRQSTANAQYSPEGSLLTGAARVFAVSALQREQSGDKAAGLAIRRDLARVGALLRRDGTTIYSGINGRSLVAYAASRPGGAIPLRFSVPDYGKKASDEKSLLAEAQYVAYLNTAGYPEEARWFALERAREREANQITSAGSSENLAGGTSVVWATVWLSACYMLLGNLVWVLLAGGLAQLVARGARVQDAAALHPAVSRAVTILVGLPFWVSSFVGLLNSAWAMSASLTAWLTVVTTLFLLVIPALYLWHHPRGNRQEMSRDQRVKEGKHSLILYGKTIGFGLPILAAVGSTLPAVVIGPVATMLLLKIFYSHDHADPTAGAGWFLVAVGLFASIGLLFTVACSLYRSLRRKVPASVGLARDLRHVALPLATVLLIAYAGALLTLSRLEVRAKQNVTASIRHEGRYYAEQTGAVWPDLVSDSGSKGVRP